jgi:hypothetical protein
MTTHFGDWSNHDWTRGSVDFAAMARDGIAGGWHKTSDGLSFYQDPYWPAAIARMKTAFPNGPYGSYHVLWGNRDLAGQVDWWFSILDKTAPGWRTDPRFVLVLDCESFGYNGLPTIGQVNTAGDIIRSRVPKVPGAYCPEWAYGTALANLRYPHIASKYGANPAVHYPAAYPGDGSTRWIRPGGRSDVLQYGSLTVMGVQSTCDADAYLGPVSGLLGLFTIGGLMVDTPVWDYGDFPPPPDPWATWRDRNMHLAIGFMDLVGAEVVGHSLWNPNDQSARTQQLGRIEQSGGRTEAALAGLAKQLGDLTTAFQAVAAGGTSLDTGAVIAHINERGDQESALVSALQGQVKTLTGQLVALQQQLHAAAAAEAAALEPAAPPAQSPAAPPAQP